MSMNYTQLTQAMQDYTENYETTFVTNIPFMIRQTEQRVYNSVQIPQLRKNATSTLTIGSRYLEVPSDFLAPFEMTVYVTGGSHYPVINKDVGWMREAFPDPATVGRPDYYAIFSDDAFILSATPDIAYNVELHYYHYPESIVDAANGTTWLGDNFDSVLLYGCLVEAYTFLKGEQDLLVLYDTKFKEALALLQTLGGRTMQDAYKSNPSRLRASGAMKATS